MPIAPLLTSSPGKLPLADYKPLSNDELSRRIDAGRQKLGKRLLILGHHYQQDEVIDHADLRGDSYQLSEQAASSTECRTIIFCGVHFMAETADILANRPEKIAERGHHICPYSNATKGNIEVTTEIA